MMINLNIGDKQAKEALISVSQTSDIPADTIILREGQYVKVVPVVLDGLIKVYIEKEDKDFLLYYIHPGQSCILSFSAGLRDQKSRVFAMTVEPTKALLIPVEKLRRLVREYPSILRWYTDLYHERYYELIDTFESVIFKRLDQRTYEYLKNKASLQNTEILNITHREIATDLGTAREVITRVLKKLEREKKIQIINGQIKIL